MTGIDELRATLTDHARDVDAAGVGPVVRRDAVRRRVAVTRRRRRAGAAAALAVAVVAVGGAVVWTEDAPEAGPAGPSVFGRDIPTRLDSLGFVYDYSEHVSGTGGAVVELPASDEPRLVSWATSDADRVRVTGPGVQPAFYDGDDFDDWIYLPAGAPRRVGAAVAEGDVALAVYEVSDSRPRSTGLGKDGITFRRTLSGSPLIAAYIGDPGQTSLDLEFSQPAGTRLRYAVFCTGGSEDTRLSVTPPVTRSGPPSFDIEGCDGPAPVDATSGDYVDAYTEGGDDLLTRLELTSVGDGRIVEDDDARVGVAVYRAPATGTDLSTVVERDGHRWRLVESSTVRAEEGVTTVDVPDGEADRLLLLAQPVVLGRAGLGLGLGGRTIGPFAGVDQLYSPVPLDARDVEVTIDGSAPAGARVVLGYYERAD